MNNEAFVAIKEVAMITIALCQCLVPTFLAESFQKNHIVKKKDNKTTSYITASDVP